jgi:hypothetical protein
MSLELFARQSLSGFISIYSDLYDGKPIPAAELEAAMWGRMCAKQAGVTRAGFKVPFDNIRRAKVTLPYMPDDINYNGCPVIKKNGGLYTPCCGKVAEDAFYCKTCSVDKEGNAKTLEFGTTDTREQSIEDGRFTPISYGDWLKKSKSSLPEVYAKLANCGVPLEIPAEHLVCEAPKPKTRKGRPAKAVDEDSSDSDEPKAKKAPKPRAKKAESSDSDEEAKPVPKAKKAKAASDSESGSDTEKPKLKPVPKKRSPTTSPEASDSDSENPIHRGHGKLAPLQPLSAVEREVYHIMAAAAVLGESDSEDEAPAPKAEKASKAPKAEKAP